MSEARADIRARIISAAIKLLDSGGRDAVTTRAVADAAGVQVPALYRLFGDKQVLLDAVAEHGFTAYLSEKMTSRAGRDPVEDLRTGWDLHVAFGLSHPAIYRLMYAEPRLSAASAASETSYRVLTEHLRQVAAVGRLRFSEERAAQLFHASACGTVLTLLAGAEEERDEGLSEIARDLAIVAITTNTPAFEGAGPTAAAVTLRAILPEVHCLSEGERALLTEWLDRLAES